ncbi:hypothetical protein [Catellatospora chokoriensis]|uniref:Uncharacterized protein n=1 Tax=Catellatospora chokoriensis TaxID=310353 RepID=A0A8J3NTC0_9ACTN|nr:hypothetical protein [Catellatospora chokoriensis]GIF91513.1 hypothetical protein Cch02nite_49570 [Catellatospora chokoriensis]
MDVRTKVAVVAAPIAVAIGIGGYLLGDAAGSAAGPTPAPMVSTVRVAMPGPTQVITVTVAPPPAQPVVTIEDGTWTVGVDIKPGKYRTVTTVDDGCYWKIAKAGTNGDNIIANDIVNGGRPTVTIKVGQEFTSNRCGTWQKVG